MSDNGSQNGSAQQRTHELLQKALIELTAERGFDAITVGDIAKRAKVNRATFYRHYQDKYDLVEQIFYQAINQLAIDLRPPGEAVVTQDPENPPERWVKFFSHFAAHERLYDTLLGRKGSSWFVARMRDHFISLMDERERLRDQLPTLQRKTRSPKVPREVALTLTANLITGTIAWWLESGKQYSPRQIAMWFLELLINGYVKVIGL